MRQNINVALFTSVFFNNIGNGFLDLATEYELNEILPENAKLVKVSQCANFAASLGKMFLIKENPAIKFVWNHLIQNRNAKKAHNKAYISVNPSNVFSPASIFHFDYLVIPGCVLTIHFFKIYMEFLRKKKKQNCKIIFIGASGNYYTDDEIRFVTECLKEIRPYAIMTRDKKAYDLYGSYCNYSYNGIDNAFFVNKLDIPRVESDFESYVVVNLELHNNSKIKKQLIASLRKERKDIIYTDHCPYPYSKVISMVKKDNTVISDYPLDYLLLYKNVDTVYTDRVHATITTLSFGNKVVLFSESPRKALFENVGIECDNNKVLKIDPTILTNKQNQQLEFLKTIIK